MLLGFFMGDPFSQAWDLLLKMPYHGTDLASAEKILSGGTKARKDPRPYFRSQPATFFMAEDEKEARYHARKKAARSGSPPALLHITDEGVESVPHKRSNVGTNIPEIVTHGYPSRISPEHISLRDRGPDPSMDLAEIRWRDDTKGREDMFRELDEMDDVDAADDLYWDWHESNERRKNQLRAYREELRTAGW